MRTRGSVLRTLGRVALWSIVGLLLVRGLGAVMQATPVTAGPPAHRNGAASWPDDETRAFAADFARGYLSYSPKDGEGYKRKVLAFASPAVANSIVPTIAPKAAAQMVQGTSIARVVAVDRSRALVTVAATVQASSVSTRYLTVPVARDGRGGLVVYDLPSLSAGPARGDVEAVEDEPLPAADRAAIEDVTTRFLRAFLAGQADELAYLVPSRTRIAALDEALRFVALDSATQVGPGTGRVRTVRATVRARDAATGAVYELGYRLRLVRSDRWYVAAVNAREG